MHVKILISVGGLVNVATLILNIVTIIISNYNSWRGYVLAWFRAGAKRKLVYSNSPMKSIQTLPPPPRKAQRGCHHGAVAT